MVAIYFINLRFCVQMRLVIISQSCVDHNHVVD